MTWLTKSMLSCLAGASMLIHPAARAEVVQAIDVQIPFKPVLANSAGVPQLTYELHLTNFSQQPIIIDRIAVLDQAANGVVTAAEGDTLAAMMGRAGQKGPVTDRQIAPGSRSLVYFNIPLSAPAPRAIAHRIEFRLADDQAPQSRQLNISPIQVVANQPVVLGPPLRGGPWAAVYAPDMERGHRRVVYATNGAALIPGRFAIDWIRLDEGGRSAPQGAIRLDQFHGYGAEVLAVADATVASVRDDVVEPETLAAISKVSIGDASGNYVALNLGGGRYAFYEHLQRGILVRQGQRVKRGDVIGRVGLTGQGSSPHLHFHLANANSLLGAEGLPFRIDRIDLLGGYPSIEAFGRGGPWTPLSRRQAAGPIAPGPNMIVRFPE